MGKCKFLQRWLEKKDSLGCTISVWGKRFGESDLFCSPCDTLVSTAKGFYAIKQHYETDKHKANYAHYSDPSQLHLFTPSDGPGIGTSGIHLYSIKDASYHAELIWCLKLVAGNAPANFCKDIGSVFRCMFPSSGAVPSEFKLNPTKVRYLMSDALGPYFRKRFLKELGAEYYSLLFDETTNNAGAKELQTAVRYWSGEKNEVVTHHLETFFMGHATAQALKENLLLALNSAELPLSKLLMLGSDGPKVNQKVFSLMNEEVKLVRGKGLLDIGFCNIHMVHNSFQKGLEELGSDASDLIIAIYRYFKDWPSRWEDFTKIQNDKGLPNLHFIKHVSSRWLTIEPATVRLLDQWDAIIEYFLKYVPSKQQSLLSTNGYRRILQFLKKKSIKAELKFVCISSSLFSTFTGLYQREEPLIHVLHEHLKELVILIMGRCCKKDAVESFQRCPSGDAFKVDNLLQPKDIPLTDEMESLMANLTQSERQDLILQMRKHYVAAGKYIVSKKIINSKVLRSFGCLRPNRSNSQKQFKIMSSCLPLQCNEEKLLDEWQLVQLENAKIEKRIDHYWSHILVLKAADGTLKYPNVARIVKAALTVSHGSSEVERGFSRSARILTEDRVSMSVRVLNARINIADGLKSFNNKPELVPITEELIQAARMAYRSYCDYLEQEKKKLEEEKRKQKGEEELRLLEEEKEKKLEENKQSIELLKTQLKTAKSIENEHISAVNELLEEANKKLKTAIDRNDFGAARVAQTILEGAVKNNEKCKQKRKAVSSLEKQIDKKKDSVITNFFKKPKI